MIEQKEKAPTAFAKLKVKAAGAAASSVDEQDTRKGVQSVEHAFSLLEIFQSANKSIAIKELAEKSGMPASKVHHYLVSLVRCGVVQQTTEGNYDLGSFALQLGLSALHRLEPIELAEKSARRLRDKTGETTFISVWGSHGPTIIRYFEGVQPVTVEVRAGHVLPLATSATGKVFVAWGSEYLTDQILTHEQIDQKRIREIGKEALKMRLGRVEGELLPRISALAAPVFDMDGQLALVMTQLGWTGEFDCALDGRIATALARACQQLSVDLGFKPD